MRDSDDSQFLDAWRRAYRLTGNGRAPDAEQMEGAFEALRHYPLEIIQAALNVHIRDPETGQYQPKPADVTRQIEGTPQMRATEAWGIVREAIKRVSPYSDVVFSDPIIHCVIRDLGGWGHVTGWESATMHYEQQRFERAYIAYSKRSDTPPYPRRLVGMAGSNNEAMGYEPPAPTLVGDRDRCMRVLAGGEDTPSLVHRPEKTMRELMESAKGLIGNE